MAKVGVIGAGSWGIALAKLLRTGMVDRGRGSCHAPQRA